MLYKTCTLLLLVPVGMADMVNDVYLVKRVVRTVEHLVFQIALVTVVIIVIQVMPEMHFVVVQNVQRHVKMEEHLS